MPDIPVSDYKSAVEIEMQEVYRKHKTKMNLLIIKNRKFIADSLKTNTLFQGLSFLFMEAYLTGREDMLMELKEKKEDKPL